MRISQRETSAAAPMLWSMLDRTDKILLAILALSLVVSWL